VGVGVGVNVGVGVGVSVGMGGMGFGGGWLKGHWVGHGGRACGVVSAGVALVGFGFQLGEFFWENRGLWVFDLGQVCQELNVLLGESMI
jgi:hypothetical protein